MVPFFFCIKDFDSSSRQNSLISKNSKGVYHQFFSKKLFCRIFRYSGRTFCADNEKLFKKPMSKTFKLELFKLKFSLKMG
jgi:hypothetical protein